MRALTSLVIGLGVSILAAAGALVWGLFTRAQGPAPPARDEAAAFGTVDLGLPEGCAIGSIATAGERLIVQLVYDVALIDNETPVAACERILVLDPKSGRVLGTILPRAADKK